MPHFTDMKITAVHSTVLCDEERLNYCSPLSTPLFSECPLLSVHYLAVNERQQGFCFCFFTLPVTVNYYLNTGHIIVFSQQTGHGGETVQVLPVTTTTVAM